QLVNGWKFAINHNTPHAEGQPLYTYRAMDSKRVNAETPTDLKPLKQRPKETSRFSREQPKRLQKGSGSAGA
ncbi:MAG: hypothetical protein KDB68_15855, partial [Planctomycetes bacterium]|nr:hypothetical protein [Planctomycetota bacterium]